MMTSLEHARALPNVNSITIQRLDGGWIVVAAGDDVPPIACRTVAEVIAVVRTFLGEQSAITYAESVGDPPEGAHCVISRVVHGYLVMLARPPHPVQYVRFRARDVLVLVLGWLGCAETGPSTQTPKIAEEHHQ
jgi:hypothetical protein